MTYGEPDEGGDGSPRGEPGSALGTPSGGSGSAGVVEGDPRALRRTELGRDCADRVRKEEERPSGHTFRAGVGARSDGRLPPGRRGRAEALVSSSPSLRLGGGISRRRPPLPTGCHGSV